MLTRFASVSMLLAVAAPLCLPVNAEAFGRRCRTLCCTSCCVPCPPCPPTPCHCHCLAYRDPYNRTGKVFVWCRSCPHYLPSWNWCYVYSLQRWDWVLVYKCFYAGMPFDKEAQDAEGYREGSQGAIGDYAPASIVVTLPADAKLTIDDRLTTSKSGLRKFATPQLPAGKKFQYTLKSEVMRDGVNQVVTRQITVRAGEETQVDLENGAADASAR